MKEDFKLLMISAMYENGGNVTHRFLDGHPEMYVYPFESQLGSSLVNDSLSSTFPLKYRWPVFDMAATPEMDYKAIIDEEGKVRARTSNVSKFRHMPFDFSDDERAKHYMNYVNKLGRSRGNNINAFFRATFDSWKDYNKTGKNYFYVGYSPIIVVDAEKIFFDLPGAHVLHVVRNPWSAYADTKKRPVPLSIENYTLCWNLNQYHALLYKKKFPDRMHIVRYEDVVSDPTKTLGDICQSLGLEISDSLKRPTWNSEPLDAVYPWGTIRKASPEANLETARELSKEEYEIIGERTWQYIDVFNFGSFAK